MRRSFSSSTQSPHTKAFTLIELLTVIAIIGILASILIPVVGKVRESARSAKCASMLRNIGTAVQLYALDNGGRLPNYSGPNMPPGWQWLHQLSEVMERRYENFGGSQGGDTYFFCPNSVALHGATAQANAGASYGMNMYMTSGYFHSLPSGGVRTLDMVANPSTTALAGDAQFNGAGWASAIGPLYNGRHLPSDIHGGEANVVFVDSHVARVRPEELPTDANDPFWGRELQ